MPVRIGRPDNWTTIEPTTDWKVMPMRLSKEEVEVATDLYYVTVEKQ